MRKNLICFLMAAFMAFGASMGVQAAQGGCDTYEGGNVGSQDYSRWTATRKSYTSVCDDGALMRIQYVRTLIGTEPGVLVEYYDKDYNLQRTRTKKVPQELPIFGGFHETDTNYYLVTGQTNSEESADVEVYRITKYDKDWNRISSAGLYDCNTTVPFDAGTARMDDNGKYLIIHTCHEMYKSSDGYNHQANVTIQVDMDNMKITDSFTDVMNSSVGYVSHSFNQFVKIEGNNLVTVDHGDAHPRGIVLIKYPTDITTGSFTPGYGTCKVINVMEFAGSSGNNTTGAAIGGFEISSSSYLIAGHSVVQDEDFASHKTRNVFVAAVDRTTNEVAINWLTDFAEGDGTTSTPQLVKTGDDQFMVLWSRNGKVCCQQIGADGLSSGTSFEHEGSLSDDEPVVSDGKLLWYTWKDDTVTFQDIEVTDPSSSTVTPIENGHQYENLGVTDGKAHLRCTVCGGETELTVATSLAAYWNKVGPYSSYSSVLPQGLSADDTLYMLLQSEPADADKKMEVEIGNPGRMEYVETGSLQGYFRLLKPGDNTITIYPKYNPECKITYDLTVTGPLQMDVDLSAVEPSPQPFHSTVTLSALAVGGSGEIQYRFAVVDAAGNETLLQDYAATNTVTWTPAAVGTYRILADIKDGAGTELPQQVIEEYIVSKAAAPVLEASQKSYREGLLKENVPVDFASELPADRGTTTYKAQIQYSDAGKDWLTASVSEDGILTYTVSDQTVTGNAADIILTADSANYEPVTLTVALTIVDGYPVTPSTEYPVTLARKQLTYGQRLSDLVLNTDTAVFTGPDGEVIAGTLAWVDPGHIPTVAETTAEWIFTPAMPEFEDYKTCTGTLEIAVAKAVVKVNAPKVPGQTYHPAAALEKISLDGTDGSAEYDGSTKAIAGIWSWKKPDTVPTAGTNGYAAVFTPDDTDNYEIAECEVTVPVAKALTVIQKLPEAGSLTFGQSLKDAALTGGGASLAAGEGMEETVVSGSFSWADETVKPAVSDSDTTEYTVFFTPEDADNYETVASKMTVTVAKAPAQPKTVLKTYCEGIAREKEQVELSARLPEDCGKVAYTFVIQDKASVLKKDSVSVSEDGFVTYGIENTAAAGDKAQIIVTASSENYEDTDYTIDIEITEKLDVIQSGKVMVSGSLAYGQKLSELELSREDAQFVDIDGNYVDGMLAWSDGELLPSAGTVSAEWTFTPDKEEYAICTGRVDVTVTRTVPMLTETGLSTEPCPYTAGLTLDQIRLVDTKVTAVYADEERVVEGSWSWAEPDTKLSAGTVSCKAVFTPKDIANYEVVEAEIKVQVDKETLKLSENPTTSVLTYGQTLGESVFSGGKVVEQNGGVPVAGSFSWDKPDTTLTVGENIYMALFTPEDTENYVPAEIEVTVEVLKAVVQPMEQSKEYREGYAKADEPVNFAAMLPENRGATTYNAQIQYNKSGKDWLTAQVNEEGILTYTVTDQTVVGDVADIILNADSENYEPATLTVHVTIVDGFPVTQSAEHLVALADNQLTYGQRLNRLVLNTDTAVFTGPEGEPVEGTLSWKDPDCIPKASETKAEWIFTPLLPEYEEYKECTGTLEIAVAKAFVKATSPKVTDQTYHPSVTLANIAINGTDGRAEYDGKIEKVAGVWSWEEPQTVPSVGAKPYAAVFTPDDAENYGTVECEVTVPVAKAKPEVQVVPAVDSFVFGEMLGDRELTGGKAVLRGRAGMKMVSVPGTFAWSDVTAKPAVSDSGKTEYEVVFTPEDTESYETAVDVVTVTVEKASFEVKPLSKRYCQNIARNEQVNLARLLPKDCGEVTYAVAVTDQDGVLKQDSVSVSDGTLSYSILESAQAGNTAQITVTAVSENYEDTTITIGITITDKLDVKVRDEVTVSDTLAYGQYLRELPLGQGSFADMDENPVMGKVSWAEPEMLLSKIGTVQAQWIFTPDDEQYSTYTDIIEVQVDKAVPALPEGSLSVESCTYRAGLKLGDISLLNQWRVTTQYAGELTEVEGSWNWAQPDTGLAAGSVPYKAVFTPDDTEHYTILESDVNVQVAKAVPETAEMPTASAITYGQTLEAAVPGGGKMVEAGSGAEVAGSFIWSSPDTVPAVKDSQTTQYELMFVPTDEINYNSVKMTLTVQIQKAAKAPNMPAAEQKVSCDTATLASVPLPAGWSWQAGTDAAVAAGADGTVFTAVYADTENYEKYSQEIRILRAADAHSWGEGVVTRQPTTEAEGEKTFTCGYCGATRTEPVEKLQPEIPSSPTTPADPSSPTTPADPSSPTTPTDPSSPTTPTDPANPSNPGGPVDPAAPQPAQGASLTDAVSGAVYTVTKAAGSGAAEVQYRKKMSASASVVNIPSEIIINGTVYKVTSIAPRAFQNNKKLKKITIGNYITDIGKYAFAGCAKLTSVTLGKQTAKLGDGIFSKCTSLKKITIPARVKKLGKNVFYGCRKLKTIVVKTKKLTQKSVSSRAFSGCPKNVTVKVPASKYKTYKKLFPKKGLSKKARIRK